MILNFNIQVPNSLLQGLETIFYKSYLVHSIFVNKFIGIQPHRFVYICLCRNIFSDTVAEIETLQHAKPENFTLWPLPKKFVQPTRTYHWSGCIARAWEEFSSVAQWVSVLETPWSQHGRTCVSTCPYLF